MKLQFRRKPKPQPSPQRPEQVYRYYKMMWEAAHPDATPEEYTAAMQKLAKEAEL